MARIGHDAPDLTTLFAFAVALVGLAVIWIGSA
jgi:hypothetical protein